LILLGGAGGGNWVFACTAGEGVGPNITEHGVGVAIIRNLCFCRPEGARWCSFVLFLFFRVRRMDFDLID
jgi:hypothetical protein